MLRKIIGLTFYAIVGFALLSNAQININTNTAYTENFDGMGATTTLPANWRIVPNGIGQTWNNGISIVERESSSGSPTNGGTYNWGQTTTERAVGAMTSGSFASPNSLMAWYRNTNLWPITQLSVSYNAERYRINTAPASIQFYYSLDGTNWNAVAAGDVTFSTGTSAYSFAPYSTNTINGINISGINITAGSSFYLRWNINTTGSNSQGIGIDDVSVTPTFTTLPTNVVGGGVNWVGANQGYTQPVNCNGASPFVMKYRRVATTTSNPSDGRGQWFTTLNAQSSGGDVTTQNMSGGSSNGFLFTNGGSCGTSGTYTNKWVFGGTGQAAIDQVNSNQHFTSGGSDMGLDMSNPGYYSFAFRDAGYANSSFYVGYTSTSPVSIFNSAAILNNDYSVSVNATLSASPSAQERFYIRYRVGSNDFTSGTSIIEGSGSGSNRTFIIPTQTVGSTIYYYLFSSTLSLTALNALSEGDRSLACLQYADNNNSNFSYTIPTPTTYTWNTTGSASWTNSSSWSPVGVPANGDNVVFNNATAVMVTNVPNISLRSLVFSGTGQVAWQSSQNVVVNVGFSGAPNPVMSLTNGKTLQLNATANSIRLTIRNGFTAQINGRMEFSGDPHRFTAEAAGAISFESGSYFLGGTSFAGNAFGSTSEAIGVNGSVLFQNGSTYENIAGANPFGDAGDARVVFYPGSLYLHNSGNFPSFSGRSYANIKLTSAAGIMPNLTGSSAYSIDNLELENNVTLGLNLTASGSIRGNIIIGTGSTLSFTPSSATTIQINGTAPQSLSGPGSLLLGSNAIMSIVANSRLNMGTNIISGTGTFTLQTGSTLGIGSADGITAVGNTLGNIQTSTRNFNAGGNYVYNGNLNQQTGNGLPSNITGSLTIANNGTAGNNLVTLTNNNTSTNALNLNAGLFAAGAGQTLRINAGRTVSGAGGHVSTDVNGEGGTIEFLGSGAVIGTPNLWNVTIANSNPSGVNFANNATIYNFFTINASGFVPASGAPRYANGSTLVYNTGGSYNRGGEFGNIAGAPGYPHHVMIQNGTTLNMGTAAPPALETGGNFTLGNSTSGGFANMGNLAIPLVVRGNLTIGNASGPVSALTLSTTSLGDLVVHGNFTRYLNSFYNDNSRAIFFRGSGNSTISTPDVTIPPASSANPTTQDYGYTIIDKDISTAKVILNAPVGITEKLTLTRGIITAISQGLFITKPAPDGTNVGIAGGSADSYVDGKLYRYMSVTTDGKYSFPIGKSDVGGGVFKPVVFTTTNHPVPGSVFSAEYFGGFEATPLYGPQENFLGTLQGILRDEFWQFNKVSGHVDAAGKLAIKYDYNPTTSIFRDRDNGDPIPVCADCNVAVVKRDSDVGAGNWDFTKTDYTYDVYDPIYPEARYHTQSGFIQSGELTSFSPFTIGFNFNTILGTLPVKLLAFNGSMQQQKANLQWQIDSDKDVQHFELQHSTNGTAFTTVHTLLPAGNTYSSTHLVSMPGRHFYRLKVKEKNGRSFYSKVVVLVAGNSATFISGMQSTVVSQQAVVNLWSQQNQTAQTSLYDASGKLLAQQQQQLLRGDNQLKVAAQQLPQGVYFLQVQTADGVRQTLRWLKQ